MNKKLIIVGIGLGAKSLFSQKGGEVTIKVDGKEYGTYSLNEDKTINIDEHNIIVIKDGVVHMEDADCPDKLCIKQGKIDSNGQKIVCHTGIYAILYLCKKIKHKNYDR